ECIEDRGGGLEKVVVVARHELAELVDERAEAGPAHYRGDEACGGGEIEEQQDDRDEHPETAPEDMRDVQTAAAELRVAGRLEEDADDHDGGDGGDEKGIDEIGIGRADQMPRPDVHRAIVRPTKTEERPPSGGLSTQLVVVPVSPRSSSDPPRSARRCPRDLRRPPPRRRPGPRARAPPVATPGSSPLLRSRRVPRARGPSASSRAGRDETRARCPRG